MVPRSLVLAAVFFAGLQLAAGTARAESRSFEAQGSELALDGPCAKTVAVAVDPALRGRIAVSATADRPEELDQLAVGTVGSAARVGLAADRRECWRPDLHGSFQPSLRLIVRVPAAFPVSVSESGAGDYALGAVGPLSVSVSGSAALAADGVTGDARIGLSGNGRVEIGRLEAERLKVDISGAGAVRVRDGRIGALAVAESGTGEVRIEPVVGTASLSVSGVGSIALGGVSGALSRSVSGMATITVGGRRLAGGTGDDEN